jgi:hypothetical protein
VSSRIGDAERIAAAIDRLREHDVAVTGSAHGTAVRYDVIRPAYHLLVEVEESRFIGLEFDLLAPDGSVRLHYFVNTARYDLSAPGQAWYASATATDVVLFLAALVDGGLLAKLHRRGSSLIVPTGAGALMVKRGRIWTSAGRYRRDRNTAIREGFRPVPP